jgi:hypothetical protein
MGLMKKTITIEEQDKIFLDVILFVSGTFREPRKWWIVHQPNFPHALQRQEFFAIYIMSLIMMSSWTSSLGKSARKNYLWTVPWASKQERACQTWLCIGLWLIWSPVNNLHHPFITTHDLQTLIIFFIEIGIDQKEYRSRRSHVSLGWTYAIKRWFLHHSILFIQPHPLRSYSVFHNPDTLLDLHWYYPNEQFASMMRNNFQLKNYKYDPQVRQTEVA